MAEYYNCTSGALPVDLGGGASVRARAMSKFLVPDGLESAPELTRLVAAGKVRRLSSPVEESPSPAPSVVVESADVPPASRGRKRRHVESQEE